MSYGKTLNDRMIEVRRLNEEKGWRTGETTFGEYIALLHSEASEALEAYRDHRLDDPSQEICEASGKHFTDESAFHMCKPEGVGAELADVFIRLLDMCELYDIDLNLEYNRKMEYNHTRPYQHGGRTLHGEK